jgi:hypothetical protein
MDGRGDGHRGDVGYRQWSQAFPYLARAALSGKLRNLLEQAETAHLESAALLRALGREDRARRAEEFAAWTRLELDQPELVPATGSLRIACFRGFGAEFLDYFAVVADDSSACGRTGAQCTQTVIVDVSIDPRFAPHREIAAAADFRAVQSTPLVDRTGRLLALDEQADLNRRTMARLSASGRTSRLEPYRDNIAVINERAAVLLGLIHELVERASTSNEEEASNGG